MNHVVEISVLHSRLIGQTNMMIFRERGDPKSRTISDRKAAELAMLVNNLATRNEVRVHPFMVQGHYGWNAERISWPGCS